MLYTVVSYLPLVEEEVVHTKKFITKAEAGTEGPEDPEDENQPGPENVFHTPAGMNWAQPGVSAKRYIATILQYEYLSEGNCTPPPEI
jgi:hypothetical protein